MRQRQLFLSLSLLILLGFIWGSGYSIAKYATMNGVSPLGYAFWQTLGPAIITLLFALLRGKRYRISMRVIRFFIISGLLGIAIPNTNMYFAAPHLPAGILAVIINIVPILIYPLALFSKQEHFHPLRALGIIIGMIGLLCLVLPQAVLPQHPQLLTMLFALLSPLCFALCALYCNRYRPADCDSLLLSAGMLLGAALLLAPVVFTSHSFYTPHWPFKLPDYIVVLEVLLSSVGYILFFALINIAGPVYYSLVSGVVALTGLFWGKIIFHEHLNLIESIAIICIIFAILLVSSKQLPEIYRYRQPSSTD